MTYQELNQYILHYLTEDKTKSAIMLTGPWGTGKSYYIQNELKPFLEKKENGGHSCVIVSLYGLKDTAEISKSIFHTQESFAAQFDMKRLSEMFRNSTAEQKQQIRGVFVGMYRIGNIKSFLANDRESIVQLLEFIKADRSGDVGDRIQQLQYDWFIKNLEEIKRKLS